MPTSSTFSYVFRFEAQGEVTSSIQTLSLHMKFSIFLCLYPVDHAYNECLLTSTCASQLTSRIFQKLKDLNDVGVLMQKCIFSALPRYLLAAEWTLILIFTRQLPWQNCSTGKFLTLGIAVGPRKQWESDGKRWRGWEMCKYIERHHLSISLKGFWSSLEFSVSQPVSQPVWGSVRVARAGSG